MTTKTIKIKDLTIKELINMKCKLHCKNCPFNNYDEDSLADKLCDLVNTGDDFQLLDQEIEVEYDESK